MKRSQSLSHLAMGVDDDRNSAGESGPRRRTLPDPTQGKLIKELTMKLEKEAKERLQVIYSTFRYFFPLNFLYSQVLAELKDEKQQRWRIEDDLTKAVEGNRRLREMLEDKKNQLKVIFSQFLILTLT